MTHAHCVLDTQGYKHTFRMCNINCCSFATIAVRTLLNVALHINYLSCYNLQKVRIGDGEQQWRQETLGLERLLRF